MHRTVRLALVTTLVVLTGCAAIQHAMKAGDPKTNAPAEALVREGKSTEAADELRTLQAELSPDTRGKYGFSTCGELVADVSGELVLAPLGKAAKAVQSESGRLEAALAVAALDAAFKSVEGLPLDALKSEKYATKTLAERRAEVEAKAAEHAQNAEKQRAVLREDEEAGRVGLALHGWARFIPATLAQVQERDETVIGLAKKLFALSGGRSCSRCR